jgi:hypothetical protein
MTSSGSLITSGSSTISAIISSVHESKSIITTFILASGSNSHRGVTLIELKIGLSAFTVTFFSLETPTSLLSAFSTTALIIDSQFSKSCNFPSKTQSLLLLVVITSFQLFLIITL